MRAEWLLVVAAVLVTCWAALAAPGGQPAHYPDDAWIPVISEEDGVR